jgi:hypothetical protein
VCCNRETATYRLLHSRLSLEEMAAIRDALDRRIEGRRIETASWIPGSDWSGTPYHAIYEKGARMNPDLAALMFGLMAWEAFERHEEDWYTERFSMGGEKIASGSISSPTADPLGRQMVPMAPRG